MKLGELLTSELVQMDFTASDKWGAIRQMVDLCITRGTIASAQKEAVNTALVARENIATTGLENGVALPHATVDAIEQPAVFVAISKTGIPFESTDGNPAHILILLVIPRRGIQKHVRTLAAIARLVESASMRDALRSAREPAEVISIIKREEDAR